MNVAEILSQRNLEPAKLLPSSTASSPETTNALKFNSFLPLHYFDDENYEVLSPQEWLKKGIDQDVYRPVPAKALLPNIPYHQIGKFSSFNQPLKSCSEFF